MRKWKTLAEEEINQTLQQQQKKIEENNQRLANFRATLALLNVNRPLGETEAQKPTVAQQHVRTQPAFTEEEIDQILQQQQKKIEENNCLGELWATPVLVNSNRPFEERKPLVSKNNSGSEDMQDYVAKVTQLRDKYARQLQRFIQNSEKAGKTNPALNKQVVFCKRVLNLLQNPQLRCPMSTLKCYEKILQKLFGPQNIISQHNTEDSTEAKRRRIPEFTGVSSTSSTATIQRNTGLGDEQHVSSPPATSSSTSGSGQSSGHRSLSHNRPSSHERRSSLHKPSDDTSLSHDQSSHDRHISDDRRLSHGRRLSNDRRSSNDRGLSHDRHLADDWRSHDRRLSHRPTDRSNASHQSRPAANRRLSQHHTTSPTAHTGKEENQSVRNATAREINKEGSSSSHPSNASDKFELSCAAVSSLKSSLKYVIASTNKQTGEMKKQCASSTMKKRSKPVHANDEVRDQGSEVIRMMKKSRKRVHDIENNSTVNKSTGDETTAAKRARGSDSNVSASELSPKSFYRRNEKSVPSATVASGCSKSVSASSGSESDSERLKKKVLKERVNHLKKMILETDQEIEKRKHSIDFDENSLERKKRKLLENVTVAKKCGIKLPKNYTGSLYPPNLQSPANPETSSADKQGDLVVKISRMAESLAESATQSRHSSTCAKAGVPAPGIAHPSDRGANLAASLSSDAKKTDNTDSSRDEMQKTKVKRNYLANTSTSCQQSADSLPPYSPDVDAILQQVKKKGKMQLKKDRSHDAAGKSPATKHSTNTGSVAITATPVTRETDIRPGTLATGVKEHAAPIGAACSSTPVARATDVTPVARATDVTPVARAIDVTPMARARAAMEAMINQAHTPTLRLRTGSSQPPATNVPPHAVKSPTLQVKGKASEIRSPTIQVSSACKFRSPTIQVDRETNPFSAPKAGVSTSVKTPVGSTNSSPKIRKTPTTPSSTGKATSAKSVNILGIKHAAVGEKILQRYRNIANSSSTQNKGKELPVSQDNSHTGEMLKKKSTEGKVHDNSSKFDKYYKNLSELKASADHSSASGTKFGQRGPLSRSLASSRHGPSSSTVPFNISRHSASGGRSRSSTAPNPATLKSPSTVSKAVSDSSIPSTTASSGWRTSNGSSAYASRLTSPRPSASSASTSASCVSSETPSRVSPLKLNISSTTSPASNAFEAGEVVDEKTASSRQHPPGVGVSSAISSASSAKASRIPPLRLRVQSDTPSSTSVSSNSYSRVPPLLLNVSSDYSPRIPLVRIGVPSDTPSSVSVSSKTSSRIPPLRLSVPSANPSCSSIPTSDSSRIPPLRLSVPSTNPSSLIALSDTQTRIPPLRLSVPSTNPSSSNDPVATSSRIPLLRLGVLSTNPSSCSGSSDTDSSDTPTRIPPLRLSVPSTNPSRSNAPVGTSSRISPLRLGVSSTNPLRSSDSSDNLTRIPPLRLSVPSTYPSSSNDPVATSSRIPPLRLSVSSDTPSRIPPLRLSVSSDTPSRIPPLRLSVSSDTPPSQQPCVVSASLSRQPASSASSVIQPVASVLSATHSGILSPTSSSCSTISSAPSPAFKPEPSRANDSHSPSAPPIIASSASTSSSASPAATTSTSKAPAEESASSGSNPNPSESESECIVCFERPVNTVIYSCGHMCLCFECAGVVKEQKKECPVCRETIKDIIKTYRT